MTKYIIRGGIFLIIFLIPVLLLTATAVDAQQTLETGKGIPTSLVSCTGVTGDTACNWCTFVKLIANLIQYSIFLAVILSSLMFAYAGFLFLTNNGDPKKITEAWLIFKRTIFGIIAILASWLVVHAIMSNVAGDNIGSEWYKIECTQSSTFNDNGSLIGRRLGGSGYSDVGTYSRNPQPGDAYIQELEHSKYDDVVAGQYTYKGGGGRPSEEDTKLTSLKKSNVKFYKSCTKTTVNKKKCIFTDTFDQNTVDGILQLRKACQTCPILLTSPVQYGDETPNSNKDKIGFFSKKSTNDFLKERLTLDEEADNTGDVKHYFDNCGNNWTYNRTNVGSKKNNYSTWVAEFSNPVVGSCF